MRTFLAALAAVIVFCAGMTHAAEPVRVYLVRHAEVAEGGGMAGAAKPGPGLSAAGQERAKALAATLATAGIKQIYVSSYARTQQTAAPLAAKLGLRPLVEEQDAASLQRIAQAVRGLAPGSAVLIVGHSNTVPDLIRLLGASPVPAIQHTEFDKLFVVSFGSGMAARLETKTYGKPTH